MFASWSNKECCYGKLSMIKYSYYLALYRSKSLKVLLVIRIKKKTFPIQNIEITNTCKKFQRVKLQSSSSSITKNNKNCVVFLSLLLHIDNYSICTAWMWPMKYYMYVFRWEEALWNGGSGGGSGPVSLLHRPDLPQCREKCLCKMLYL